MTYGANQYKQMAIGTASKPQILIMLYEASIRYVKKAADCVDAGDTVGKGVNIGKAHDILNELLNTLNFDIGGDVARELERLYNFMIERLIEANVQNQRPPLDVVAKLLGTLLEGWKGAIEQLGKGGK